MPDSNRAVYAALAGNLAIAATKMIAAGISGSSAMLAEGFHSVVDTGNEALLLLGRHRSSRPPDESHPFGHGQELYFWTLIVAILIFAVGGGASVYEGITHILNPHPAADVKWSYIVLGLAAIFESTSFIIGYRQFRSESGRQGFWKAVRTSKDPTTFTVVFEDIAALLGLAVAFVGIWLGEHFRKPVFDGAASIAIGAVLMAVSVLLARESKGLLVGEGVDRTTLDAICRLAGQDRAVVRINRPLTMHFGPDTILLAIEIQFCRGLSAAAVDRIEHAVSSHYPNIRHVFIEAESIAAPGRESDHAA